MLHIGCHLSSAKGYLAMGKDAISINADTFAFFTRNPRGGKAKDINQGCIGLDALVSVINHPQLRNLPFILETPNELAGYAQEIALLKNNFLE
ncbi:MAG: hypothetical protein E7201_02775 [Selenomonas ruminantium]|uniref:Endonuclease IV n=1 Tax=Selenomonas ruminantium TaxID=971 RepID=A0A927ZWZ8_SELRU|nr:hypothetical protein [Selenomonas ruminantium]